MEELGLRPTRAAFGCSRQVDRHAGAGQHHAVVLLRARPADEPAAHVGRHALRLAVEGMAPAAATACLHPHDVAALNDIAVAERPQDALVGTARVDDATPSPRGMAAGDAPGRMLDAVDAHGD